MIDKWNRPEPIEPLNPPKRYYDTLAITGERAKSPLQDGYERRCRRPRARGYEDMVPSDQADRVERIFKPHLSEPDDYSVVNDHDADDGYGY